MRATLHFPTENYGYAEVEIEVETPRDAIKEYHKATAVPGTGLPTKEWNEVLDKYMAGNGMTPDQHERMDKAQAWFVHELDKSYNRTKPKELKTYK